VLTLAGATAMTAVAPEAISFPPTGRSVSAGQRRNIALLGVDMAIFSMGQGALGPLTLIPLFVSKLTDNPLAVGAVVAAIQIGWLPQIFIAGTIERSVRKWPWVLLFGTLERVPATFLALTALAVPHTGPWIVAVVYLCCFSQTMFGGLGVAPWLDVIARVVPGRLRGRFMGTSNTAGALLGAGSAAVAAPLLDWYPFPYNFAACFGFAACIYLVGLIPLFLVREPPGPPPRPPRPFRGQLAELPGVLRADPPFRRFLIGLCIASLATMSSGFLVVYGVSVLGAPDEIAGWYTATLFIAQTVASSAMGWLGDRFGFTAVGRSMALAVVGLSAVALLAPSAVVLLLAFALMGLVQSSSMMARLTGPMEYAPAERRPSYIALAFGTVGPCAALAPLLGGQIVAWFGYSWLFAFSGAVALLALPFLGAGARAPSRRTA
jgi:MFS family permease